MDRNNAVRVISRDTRDILGEGPLWSPIHRTLLWVDIFAPAIWRLDLASGAVQSWEAPERIGWVVEREENEVGASCIAAPVFIGGVVQAAISIAAPAARLEEAQTKKFAEMLLGEIASIESSRATTLRAAPRVT